VSPRFHAQETKTPKEKVEHDSRGGDGAEKIRLSEPAITAASATPSKGVDKWASVIGSASLATRAWLTCGGFTAARSSGAPRGDPFSGRCAYS